MRPSLLRWETAPGALGIERREISKLRWLAEATAGRHEEIEWVYEATFTFPAGPADSFER